MRNIRILSNGFYIVAHLWSYYNILVILLFVLFGENGIESYDFLTFICYPIHILIDACFSNYFISMMIMELVLLAKMKQKSKVKRLAFWEQINNYIIQVKYITLVVALIFVGILMILLWILFANAEGPFFQL